MLICSSMTGQVFDFWKNDIFSSILTSLIFLKIFYKNLKIYILSLKCPFSRYLNFLKWNTFHIGYFFKGLLDLLQVPSHATSPSACAASSDISDSSRTHPASPLTRLHKDLSNLSLGIKFLKIIENWEFEGKTRMSGENKLVYGSSN